MAEDNATATTAGTRLSIGFCCAGHLYAHLFMLLYPTVVLVLPSEFDRPYGAKFVVVLGVASLGVPMVAYIHDSTGGFTMLFLVVSAFALMVALAALFLPAAATAKVAAA